MNYKRLVFASLLSTTLLSACGGSGSSSPAVSDTSSDAASPADNNTPDNSTTPTTNGDCELDEIETEMLAQINAARAASRLCGSDSYPATTALQWSCKLEQAADSHSRDMETHNFFSHTGSDGLQVSDRVNATEYVWSAVGENIAAGQSSVTQVMEGWLNSPGHCRNIMSSRYQEVGTSKVDSTTADYQTYWTQVFAAPR